MLGLCWQCFCTAGWQDHSEGGEEDEESTNIDGEAEFQDFLDKQKRAVEQMKRDGLDYMSRICRLQGRITSTAGEDDEKCFTASQLEQIFDLAK